MVRGQDGEIARLEVTAIRRGDMIVFEQARAARAGPDRPGIRSAGGLAGQDWLENGGAERPLRVIAYMKGFDPCVAFPSW